MRKSWRRGVTVGLIQLLIVTSLGVKLAIDRRTYPRVWVRVRSADPSVPIRGRYVSLRVEAAIGPGLDLPPSSSETGNAPPRPDRSAAAHAVRLTVVDGTLVALPPADRLSVLARAAVREGGPVAELVEPVAYFVPDTAADKVRDLEREELWAEVTVPPNGHLRPIRLGVRTAGGVTPVDLR